MERLAKFLLNPMGAIGSLMLLSVVVLAVFAPLVAPYDPYERVQVTPEDILTPPDRDHLLGRDDAGKDVLS